MPIHYWNPASTLAVLSVWNVLYLCPHQWKSYCPKTLFLHSPIWHLTHVIILCPLVVGSVVQSSWGFWRQKWTLFCVFLTPFGGVSFKQGRSRELATPIQSTFHSLPMEKFRAWAVSIYPNLATSKPLFPKESFNLPSVQYQQHPKLNRLLSKTNSVEFNKMSQGTGLGAMWPHPDTLPMLST